MGIAAFGAGIVLQCLALTLGRLRRGDWRRVGQALLLALVALIPFKGDRVYDVHEHFLGVCVVFAGLFALLLRERILPYVNSTLVLAVTLVNAFLLATTASATHRLWLVWLLVSLVPSVAAALDALAGVRPGRAWQVGLYCWHLLLVVVLGVFGLTWTGLGTLLQRAGRGGDPRADFLSGAILAYLAVHAIYFIAFLRPPLRGESWAERRARWTDDVRTFDRFYLETTDSPRRAWIVSGALAAALGADLVGRWAPPHQVVRGAIALVPLLSSWLVPAPGATAPDAPDAGTVA